MELLSEYSAYRVPVAEIYVEPLFNCREAIALISVEELARAIEARGLQFPITVQPREDCEGVPEGYNYRLIVGFRRFTACTRILNWDRIPAVIRRGLSDQDARILNLTENIDRRDLNILEEARALAAIFKPGTPITQVASAVRRHQRWCSLRYSLLKLPIKVQQAAAAGIITQGDIGVIASVAPDCQLSVFNRILEQRDQREKRTFTKKPVDHRPPEEEIDRRLRALVDRGLGGFVGRLLLWAGGKGVSSEAIDKELASILDMFERTGIVTASDMIGAFRTEETYVHNVSERRGLDCETARGGY